MRHASYLIVTGLVGFAFYLLWDGVQFGPLDWRGLPSLLRGTWAWDLRTPLLPVYAVAALWVAERLAAVLSRRVP